MRPQLFNELFLQIESKPTMQLVAGGQPGDRGGETGEQFLRLYVMPLVKQSDNRLGFTAWPRPPVE